MKCQVQTTLVPISRRASQVWFFLRYLAQSLSLTQSTQNHPNNNAFSAYFLLISCRISTSPKTNSPMCRTSIVYSCGHATLPTEFDTGATATLAAACLAPRSRLSCPHPCSSLPLPRITGIRCAWTTRTTSTGMNSNFKVSVADTKTIKEIESSH